MKQILLTCGLVMGLSNLASAQITEVHTRWGCSGSSFSLSAQTEIFNYEATIGASTLAYVATLEVFHNGVKKDSSTQVVLLPWQGFNFSHPVNMAGWGLKPGDQVTFRLKVLSLSLGNLLSSHTLTGIVEGSSSTQ